MKSVEQNEPKTKVQFCICEHPKSWHQFYKLRLRCKIQKCKCKDFEEKK